LTGGAQAKNIFWQVVGNVKIQPSAEFKGNIHCATDVVVETKATVIGNIYAQTAVNLQMATITGDTCKKPDPTPGPKQSGVDLGSACNYAILAKSGISTVPISTVTGNIGVSPIAATAMTGFGLTLDGGGQFATSTQVAGQARGASYGGPVAAALTQAVLDMQAAYTDAASRIHPDASRTNINNGAIGGLTLGAGVYTFTTAISISQDLTFDGDANDVFILQTTGQLLQAVDTNVILMNGAQAKNIFWQVAGNVAIGARAHMEGIILCFTDVVFITGSSLNGGILAQTAVALQMADITEAPGTCTTTVVQENRSLRIRR
jgi:hypothetical protein